MADIRINALATTAASTASDDYIAIDGSANGTRKLNAYSPTFGGNLTVSGTGTSAFSGAIKARSTGADEVGIGPYGTGTGGLYFGNGTVSLFNDANTQLKSLVGLSLAGNLTVSGTGTSSVAGSLSVNTVAGGNPTVTSTLQLTSPAVTETGAGGLEFKADVSNNGYGFRTLPVFDGVSSYDLYTQSRSNSASWTTRMSLTNTGNLLIGTTTDGGNGKLQLATHTTSAGGIGFGTDTSLFRAASGNLGLYGTGTSSKITFSHSTTTAGKGFDVECDSAKDAYVWNRENRNIYFGTNNTTALTLDSSQNATFAGKVTVNGTDGLLVNNSASLSLITIGEAIAGSYSRLNMRTGSNKYAWSIAAQDLVDNALTITPSTAVGGTTFTTPVLTVAQSGAVTVSGAIAIGNTVQTAASVASTHKVTISIGGSTYYLLATNV